MRKFYLENEIGARKPLNGEDGIWVENPAGLGFATAEKFADNRNGFFEKYHGGQSQSNVICDLVFVRNAYEKYKELMDWMNTAERLYLIYQPSGTAYYSEVRIKSITKTELSDGKWLRTTLSLACLTPWYLPTPLRIDFTKQTSDAMRYPFTYSETLYYGISNTEDLSVELPAGGHINAGINVHFLGLIYDPTITLYCDDEIIGQCVISGGRYNGTIELETGYNDCYVTFTAGNGAKTDLIDRIDITKNPFFRLPKTGNYRLVITSSGDLVLSAASATVKYYYRSV